MVDDSIQQKFMAALTPRDGSLDVQNLVWALRVGAPNLDVPALPDPAPPPPMTLRRHSPAP